MKWVLILTILSLNDASSIEVIEGFDSKMNCELIGNQCVNSFENVIDVDHWHSSRGTRWSFVCAPNWGKTSGLF